MSSSFMLSPTMTKNIPQWQQSPDPDSIIVPGLDTNAPISDQVEQIDQLITLKLQKIDGQFARIQWLAEHKLLPAVKRYTNGVQPVREAAHFWVQFFEAAARMRVPRQDDYEEGVEEVIEAKQEEASSLSLDASNVEDASISDESTDISKSQQFDLNATPSESSFMPSAAVSSTPTTTSKHRSTRTAQQSPSWNSSIESSLNRLNEELDVLGLDQTACNSRSKDIPATSDLIQKHPSFHSKGKGKAKEPKEALLKSVLRQNLSNTSDASQDKPDDTGIPGLSSPLRQDAAKILARMNPYLPPNTQLSQWNNVVDLSTTRLATPGKSKGTPQRYEEEDSFGSDPGLGLSPPVTIGWALPAKKQPPVSQTPKKEAAVRIGQDLINNIEGKKANQYDNSNPRRTFTESFDSDDPGLGLSPPTTVDWARLPSQGPFGVFSRPGLTGEPSSTSSSISSPPSLTRYMDRAEKASNTPSELDLDSLMRHVGLDFDVKSHTDHSMADQYSHSTTEFVGGYTSHPSSTEVKTPEQQMYNTFPVGDDDEFIGISGSQNGDYNSDLSDSFDDGRPNDTINPSGAFILASQRPPSFDDDSFGSGDSFDDDGGGSGIAVHPFAAMNQEYDNGEFYDDSFDDSMHQPGVQEDTDTVFGARHAQALPQTFSRPRMSQQLRLLGEDLVEQDTHGFGYTASSLDSPTPAARGY